jgi:hypothetical protein
MRSQRCSVQLHSVLFRIFEHKQHIHRGEWRPATAMFLLCITASLQTALLLCSCARFGCLRHGVCVCLGCCRSVGDLQRRPQRQSRSDLAP